MNLVDFKALLREADKETKSACEDYSQQSAVHRAALQIIQFEKERHYGDIVHSRRIQKIKDIIEFNAEDIVNETNQARNQ